MNRAAIHLLLISGVILVANCETKRRGSLREGDPQEKPKQDESEAKILTPFNLKSIFQAFAASRTGYTIDVVVLNHTFEYNELLLLKMRNKTFTRRDNDYESDHVKGNDNKVEKFVNEPLEKKIVFIVHALNTIGFYENSILSIDKNLFLLIELYEKLLDHYDVYFMPMANPDGVAALRRDERWSKNNSPQDLCNGVALDRNFDVSWIATQQNSCSPLYAGRSAFSELESRAIWDVMKNNQAKIHGYFHVRAASDSASSKKGEALLFPFGYTANLDGSEDKFLELKNELEDAMTEGSRLMKFQCDSMHNWYGGTVRGSSVDFAYKIFGIPFAFEVLMQSYDDPKVAKAALSVVWRKVSDVIFKKMAQDGLDEY